MLAMPNLAALVLLSVAAAQEPAPEVRDLSPVLEKARVELELPAVAALVVSSERVLAHGVGGVRRAGGDSRALPEDRWHLGSCTKAMTATLAGLLVAQEETLRWDLTISAALPELSAEIRPEFRNVTLEMLLSNRGGVAAPSAAPEVWSELWKRQGTPLEQRARLARMMLTREPGIEPGQYLYSNGGFAIAGHMLERVMGAPFEDLLAQHVFGPLDMHSAGFGLAWSLEQGLSPHDASGTPLDPGPLVDNPDAIAPAGLVHASIEDWGRFVSEHLRGARGEETRLAVDYPKLQRSRSADPNEGYALGWFVTTKSWAKGSDAKAIGHCLQHAGSNNSWLAVAWIAPELDFAVLVTTNIGGDGVYPRVDALAWRIIQDQLAHEL